MEAESFQHIVDEATAASLTFNRLIEGFMGLGLVVGVAALGVISARAVVERRQQIGVLRAIGFRRGMVEALFLIESSFIALTSIVVGTVLGLVARVQHRGRLAAAAELGEPHARRAVGRARARLRASSTPSRCWPRSRRPCARRGCIPPEALRYE